MPWPQKGVTQYHALLGHTDKGRAIKGLVVCNNKDIEPLDLQNGLALGCYQPSPEVLSVLYQPCTAFAHIQIKKLLGNEKPGLRGYVIIRSMSQPPSPTTWQSQAHS